MVMCSADVVIVSMGENVCFFVHQRMKKWDDLGPFVSAGMHQDLFLLIKTYIN
jgi:hypothetical protein